MKNILLIILALIALVGAQLSCGDNGGEEVLKNPYASGWIYPRLHTSGRAITDEYGRTVMLRGINVGGHAKIPPFTPWEGAIDDQFDATLAKYMDFPADWQMNSIRLTMFWEGLEPTKGNYDENYLAMVEKQIKAAKERGIYVFIDFHQDLFSRWLGGSGAPPWTLVNPPAQPPELNNQSWFMKVFSDPDVGAAFDRFWADEDGIQTSYIEMLKYVTTKFKDYDNIIGVDIMNEPNPGINGKADLTKWYNDVLIPFYKKAAEEIRKIAPNYVIFVEPSGEEAGQSSAKPGWTIEGLANYVLSPHYYYSIQFVFGEYDGNVDALRKALTERDNRGKELGAPILLSEFGFRGAQGDVGMDENAGWYFNDIYGVMDELLMHGTVWTHEASVNFWNREDCSLTNGDWSERVPRGNAVARPYAEFTTGTPLSISYDPASKLFQYRYKSNAAGVTGGAPTVIRLPKRHFPKRPILTLSYGKSLYVADMGLLLVFDGLDADAKEQIITVQP